MCRDDVLRQLTSMFCEIGKEWGFSEPIIRNRSYVSEVYIVKKNAIQIEVDWRGNDLFMYVVRLVNGNLPPKNVVYSYDDGKWCRKYFEEIYRTKRPMIKDQRQRYSVKYLYDSFDFYTALIKNQPTVLKKFLDQCDAEL